MNAKFLSFISVLSFTVIVFGCGHKTVDINAIDQAVDNRDFNMALASILDLSDKQILESDSLMELLSTAYYGVTMNEVRDIAKDCYDMDFTPDEDKVFFTDYQDSLINIYSYPELKKLDSIPTYSRIISLDISPDGKTFVASGADGSLRIFSLESGKEFNRFENTGNKVKDLGFIDNDNVFTSSNDQDLALINIKNGGSSWQKHLQSKNLKTVSLSKDKASLITASGDGTAKIISLSDTTNNFEKSVFTHNTNYINSAVISPDNKFIVTVTGDDDVNIWNAESQKVSKTIHLDTPVNLIDISDDGKLILISGVNYLYVLNSSDGKLIAKIMTDNRPVVKARFMNDNKIVYVDNLSFYQVPILTGMSLIEAARKYIAEN